MQMSTVSTNLFTWLPESHTLVAEMSDLGPDFHLYQSWKCFTLVSHKTGTSKIMVKDHDEYSNRGELLSTVFRVHGSGEGFTVVLLND